MTRPARPLSSLIRSGKAVLGVLRVRALAFSRRIPLPPGSLRPASEAALRNPHLLLDQAQKHGPVFKLWLDGKMTTCVMGLPLGKRFLFEHEKQTRAATTDFQPLFPFGTLRQMTGDHHLEYRRKFIEAFRSTRVVEHKSSIDRILLEAVHRFATHSAFTFREIRTVAKTCLTEILFLLVFGIDRRWHGFDELVMLYDRYAPNGTFTSVRAENREAFEKIATLLRRRETELRDEPGFPCLLGNMAAAGPVDETVVGNLIQITEAGRFDVMGLWAWLVFLLSDRKDLLDKVAQMPADDEVRMTLSRAIVSEALRLEQSEFVLRVATKNISFNGYLIPERSRIRIAVWESHKDSSVFVAPFEFRPERFLGNAPKADAYAPFGLDKHLCLGADWATMLSASFVEKLADHVRWQRDGDSTAIRGVFHFEPNDDTVVVFRAASR